VRLVPVAWLTDHLYQAMLTIVTISPAGLAVIFLSGSAMNIVLPADTIQSGDAVVYAAG